MWIQWCLENLEDEDLRPFLKKCYDNLNDNGIIIVKENLYNIDKEEEEENDEEEEKEKENKKEEEKEKNEVNKNNYEYKYNNMDFSKQRPDVFYINLFMECNFKIKLHFLNPNWPETLMPLCVYVLSKK